MNKPAPKFQMGWVVRRRDVETFYGKITAIRWTVDTSHIALRGHWEYSFSVAPRIMVIGWHEEKSLRALTVHEAGSVALSAGFVHYGKRVRP